ncbi:hypothetical protein Fmac_020317 [Flemingia macrophylla]|uniref:Uncharacterized protein n=1 Tax=Flemingia macrophylla TaxID=520843 RepID=A0ABD1LTR9_9FABA
MNSPSLEANRGLERDIVKDNSLHRHIIKQIFLEKLKMKASKPPRLQDLATRQLSISHYYARLVELVVPTPAAGNSPKALTPRVLKPYSKLESVLDDPLESVLRHFPLSLLCVSLSNSNNNQKQ